MDKRVGLVMPDIPLDQQGTVVKAVNDAAKFSDLPKPIQELVRAAERKFPGGGRK